MNIPQVYQLKKKPAMCYPTCMKGLILDSSQNISLLGLSEEGSLTKSHSIPGKSSSLLPALKDFCELDKLQFIAVGIGPGSYMGLRSAATIAKTLSFALGIPLIEFSSPLAFLPPGDEKWTIVGDAKMSKLFTMTGDSAEGFTAPKLISSEKFIAPSGPILDLREELTPLLDRVAGYAHQQFIQGNITHANELQLQYLR
ncbi:MAG: tRNA threonylcarbamoyladenosine biosynthesis protein TsaB [Simkaniaceae bacterium]|nr:tRNA threonylcarbamoyladenosine biosynthesis protein TsaB [Candidatus Sacchlamyda saccharinae]